MPAIKDDIDTSKVAVIGVVTALIILTLVFLVKALYYQTAEEIRQTKDVQPVYRPLAQYQIEQQEKLHRYAWVDRGNNTVAIPIEQAMSLTVKELDTARKNTATGQATTENTTADQTNKK